LDVIAANNKLVFVGMVELPQEQLRTRYAIANYIRVQRIGWALE